MAVCAVALLVAGLAVASALSPPVDPPVNLQGDLWPLGSHSSALAGTDAMVEQLLAHMSLEDKIGQMIQADIASITPEELRTYKLGSILAGGGAAPGNNIRSSPQAWLKMTDDYHRAALTASNQGHDAIPILFGIDAVHGHAKVIGATIFPHNVGLGAAHDPDLIYRIGQATAQEVSSSGIDWTFAPTVAVVRDARWGRSYESYSESSALVAQYARAMVTGLQGEINTPQFMSPGHTLSSVKHFIGDGGTLDGRDQGNAVVTEAELRDVHAGGYLAAIEAGAMIVMASYNSWNGVKLHGNHYLLTDVLKGRLAFDGFVVGDWNAHEQVPGCTKFDCSAAIVAGVDMLMAPDGWKDLYRNTLAEAKAGTIPPARIDDAVRRILRVKALAGLFKRPAEPERSAKRTFDTLGSKAHRALAREAVRKSLVLLKNARGTLPINPHATVLVAGAAADDIGTQSGGWTIDWQGDHNKNADFPGATSIYAGIQAAVTAAGGTVTLSRDGSFSKKPDVAIVVFGEGPYAEFEGDRETLEFSPGDDHELQLLRRLQQQGVPTVSVFLSGRPLWVNPEINASDAFVAAWLPGSEGEGVADVLFRSADGATPYDFTGRLAFSWPRTAMSVSFDAAGQVSGALFARGSGLDYRSGSNVPELSEDPEVPLPWRAPAGSLFHAGHVIAPWSLFVADAGEEVHVTTARQQSPHGAIAVTLEGDGATATWNGSQNGVLIISGRASDLDLQASQGANIDVRYRVDRTPERNVKMGMHCVEALCGGIADASLDLTRVFKSAPLGEWQNLKVPLSCWTEGGVRLRGVDVPFSVATVGRFGVTIADVRLSSRNDGAALQCP
jgi:beta-glucosidase